MAENNEERAKHLLAAHRDKVKERLTTFIGSNGVRLPLLRGAMQGFINSVLAPPEDVACQAGCCYCCHLLVGVSIPEVLVIYNELVTRATPEGLAVIRQRVMDRAGQSQVLENAFWLANRSPCPFLDEKGLCLIYDWRPFSCRAYHSTEVKMCRESFEKGAASLIPCFNLYRALTDIYSSIFIQVMVEKGLASFQVGFIKALAILFTEDQAVEAWLNREDVFSPSRLSLPQ